MTRDWYGFKGYYYSPNCGADGSVDGYTWTDSHITGNCYNHEDMWSLGMGNDFGYNGECNTGYEVIGYHSTGCKGTAVVKQNVYKSTCITTGGKSMKSFKFFCR